MRSSHLGGQAQTEQHELHTILKSQIETMGSLSKWIGVECAWNAHAHVWNAQIKTKTHKSQNHTETPWHCRNVRNVMWSLKYKIKQNQCHGPEGSACQLVYAIYNNNNITAPYILPPLRKDCSCNQDLQSLTRCTQCLYCVEFHQDASTRG